MKDESSRPPRTRDPRPEQPEFGLIHSDDSDFPLAKKRKGVGPIRKIVGWVLFLGLLVVFALVMEHRLKHPQIRYVKNAEDVFDESLAAAHNKTVTRRPRPARRTSGTELKKAVKAYNDIEDACGEAVHCWNRAAEGLPSGTITPGIATDAAATFDGRFAELDSADRAIDELARRTEDIKQASRAPGRDALNLSALYSAARNLESVMRSQSRVSHDVLRMERQFFEGAAERERGDCVSATDALHGCWIRLDEQRSERDRAVENMRDAADRVFD
jgi:hypothetical protein